MAGDKALRRSATVAQERALQDAQFAAQQYWRLILSAPLRNRIVFAWGMVTKQQPIAVTACCALVLLAVQGWALVIVQLWAAWRGQG